MDFYDDVMRELLVALGAALFLGNIFAWNLGGGIGAWQQAGGEVVSG